MGAAASERSLSRRPATALLAGGLRPPPRPVPPPDIAPGVVDIVVALVEEGTVTEPRVDESVRLRGSKERLKG